MKNEDIERKTSEFLVNACHRADHIYLRVARRELTSMEGNKKLCKIKHEVEIIDTKNFSDDLVKLKISCVNMINSYIRSVG